MPELAQIAERLARALVAACNEHGLPNRFVFRELAWFYGGPPPLLAGLAAKRYRGRLEAALRAAGWCNVQVQHVDRLLDVRGVKR